MTIEEEKTKRKKEKQKDKNKNKIYHCWSYIESWEDSAEAD